MHEHGATCRRDKPACVIQFARLAGARKVPGAVHPVLDPGMIVLAVRPPRRIDLARRNADRTKRIDIKDRFLAAAPLTGLQKAGRGNGSAVARHIAALCRAGIIDRARKRRTGERFFAVLPEMRGNARRELFPHRAKLLVVHTRQQHILEEVALRERPYLCPLAVKCERRTKEGEQCLRRKIIATEICLRQHSIEIAECRFLSRGHRACHSERLPIPFSERLTCPHPRKERSLNLCLRFV